MKHRSLVRLNEETASCAKAASERRERLTTASAPHGQITTLNF